jgi:hypothetical protein
LTPRLNFSLPVSELTNRVTRSAGFIRRPSKLTLGAAAATAVAVAGIAAGLTAGSGPAAGDAAALNRATVADGSQSAARPQPASSQGSRQPGAGTGHLAHRPSGGGSLETLVRTNKPYEFYDSVIPSAIPAGGIAAVYATGPYAASPSQVAGRRTVIWIDVTGTDPAASALDTEPSDATPQQAADWALARLRTRPHAIARIYTMLSEWPAVQADVASTVPAAMRSRIRWWIADPTGVPHLVPGSDATQWYWGSGYDISTAKADF